ncbi:MULTISPECIES: ATP phosphoribosyltransferase [Dictyoglomus]|jgi:ATP phosphoribosyltransferase|uniref:ATP phosphoribosyltransferase n=1 Tax=Dictyoglomus turgidum (strain DSM 6724 / Z-1310) TaxID=515635 RepID=HIS1_DICTD|nr:MULTISPECIES: ATP phosphoribosyltransferase [Dictyoglomus]B8E2C2.1 RecName: Full=ATP phosphoribosyltransferase; Short=ATP-PRT; Short=ATP-PRTase [Dictyoglomus turgidum DSM 6724]ACK42399.1 ATP phosphoribosyltransferase [Dictyoglomus turgidum DSM 6724]HBU32145.1 ATP phosphoribosyltransferase [Dictyoglomus sp.]
MIRVAIPTGRMLEQALDFLRNFDDRLLDEEKGRKLRIHGERFEVFLAKPWDLPLYVEERVVDLGIIGRDVIWEQEKNVVNLISLPFGYCKMVIAGYPYVSLKGNGKEIRIATKYENITKKLLENRWGKIKIIKLNGSVELGPILNISDLIVDIVETGKTLRDNGLEVKEVLFESSACLISNVVSFAYLRKEILSFVKEVRKLNDKCN